MCIMYILYKGSNSPAKKSFLLYKYLINNKLKDFCSLCLYSCVTLRTKALKIILSYVYFSYLLQRDITKRFGNQILLQYLERISDAALSAYLWCCIYATPPSMHTAQTCLARMQYSTVLLLVQKNTVLTFS